MSSPSVFAVLDTFYNAAAFLHSLKYILIAYFIYSTDLFHSSAPPVLHILKAANPSLLAWVIVHILGRTI